MVDGLPVVAGGDLSARCSRFREQAEVEVALALAPAVLFRFVECKRLFDQGSRQRRVLRHQRQPERGGGTRLADADAELAMKRSARLELHASGPDRTLECLRQTRKEE